ncbi:MAG TPA: DUF3570 domain-containing protein [Polyangiaceae bacterium]|nr:DUF3570 domain-containing protein [Polyangiaceae bacterium]
MDAFFSSRARAARLAAALAGLGLSHAPGAGAQVVDIDLGASGYIEPSGTSALRVINPSVSVTGRPTESVGVHARYEADIVSGATETVKAGSLSGVDVVSSATSFDDTRHIASGGLTVTREDTELAASYAYSTENDYRSHSLLVSAGTTFFQKNTELVLSYARSFDDVCTSRYPDTLAPTARLPLDSSRGCFTSERATRDVSLDELQLGWTQAFTPVLVTQLALTGGIQHGFLANPYRSVVISPSGDRALEHHPNDRLRGAVALRARLYVRGIETAFGAGVRLYRDTWDVFGASYEVTAERYLFPALRIAVRGRYSHQTGALFYSDDYIGGEPIDGVRGQYFTGDRELSPLSNLLFGGRLLFAHEAPRGERILGILSRASASLAVDVVSTDLERFTWGGVTPDDTLGLLGSLGIKTEF